MQSFGYLERGPPDSEALYTSEAIKEAISNVQKFGGLNQTGELDEVTREVRFFTFCVYYYIHKSIYQLIIPIRSSS